MTKSCTKLDEYSYNHFVEQLVAGNITDFSLYLKPEYDVACRHHLVTRGLLVDECIAVANEHDEGHVIYRAIECGYGQQHYEKWAKNSYWPVRMILASKGYFPDLFSQDTEEDVRTAVLKKHPQYAKYLLDTQSKNELKAVAHAYRNIKEPNFDELETLLAHPLIVQNRKLRSLRDDLQTKFETRHIQLSTIDKTMSVAQLFMANSEGWKRLVNAIQLRQLNQYEKRLRNHPNCEELITEYIQFENYEILQQLKAS